MATQLLKTTTVYLVDTEEEAVDLIEKVRNDQLSKGFILTKSSYVLKTKKSKGEIIEAHYQVVTEQTFD